MVVEGNGWEVIDLGVDVKTVKFIESIEKNPESIVGLSALTTNNGKHGKTTIKDVKEKYPNTVVEGKWSPLSKKVLIKWGVDIMLLIHKKLNLEEN
ncbi:MAG: hypothetical protein H6611_03155 [Ignavibacteriales bacterium]|nr:hypothetical protein [Ignavibacteriales bacterium]